MERFKLNDKEYFIEVKNNQECIITEFGNKNNQYSMSIEELRNLKVDFDEVYAFSDYGITSDVITDINIAALTEEAIMFSIILKNSTIADSFKMPIKDFCEDVMSAYLSPNKEDKCISEKMKNFKAAFDYWKTESRIPFMNTKCAIYNLEKEMFGAGYFDKHELIVISRCNLAMLDKVIIAMPYYASKAKLVLDKKVSNCEYVYYIKNASAVNDMALKETVAQHLDLFDLKNQEEHERVCKFFKLKEVGKVESNLNNFFNI